MRQRYEKEQGLFRPASTAAPREGQGSYLCLNTHQPKVSSISPAKIHKKAESIHCPSSSPRPKAIMQPPRIRFFLHTKKHPPAKCMQRGVEFDSAAQIGLADLVGLGKLRAGSA